MATKAEQYIPGLGRRKTAVARVRITPAKSQKITINEKSVEEYFPTPELQATALGALTGVELTQKFTITAHVTGGGISAQAEAVRHGIARALVTFDGTLRGTLKGVGFLKRDPRMVERKKFGLKKARKAPQWSKR